MEEIKEQQITDEATPCETKKSKINKCKIGKYLFYSLLIVAIIGIYILHFIPTNKNVHVATSPATPGTGEILFVNIDTISEKYKLVDILTKDIENEINKQTAIFDNKENAFQKKYNQFQKNYEAGILTEIQIQHTTAQLQEEYQTIIQDKQTVLSGLEERHATALVQVSDSIRKFAQEINQQKYNASFIFVYQKGTQMIYGDPTKDITDEVLTLLNRNFKK